MSKDKEKFHQYHKDGFALSTNPDLLNIDTIHVFLYQSYWSRGIPKDLVIKSIQNSLCFGLYEREKQVGFARIITDYTTYAEICDVFVLEAYRGRGLGKWMMERVVSCPELRGLRTLALGAADAHEF